jgi:hypothetical protein
MSAPSLAAIARALGGIIAGRSVLAPGPGHSPRDRSLSVTLSATSPDGFMVHSHAGDDWRACRRHVRGKLGLALFKPGSEPRVAPQRERKPEATPSNNREARLAPLVASDRTARLARRSLSQGAWPRPAGRSRLRGDSVSPAPVVSRQDIPSDDRSCSRHLRRCTTSDPYHFAH